MEKLNTPEVTVGVITYNSSRTVLQTLESIKAQTYDKIRLIISDDCSTDDTVNVCKQWIAGNSSRFVSADIVTASANTGVAGNCNRAWDACQSYFFKAIAGDDYLLPDCIENNVSFMLDNPSSVVVFSKVIFVGRKREIKRCRNLFDYSFFNLSVSEQHKWLVEVTNCIPASTSFYRMQRIRDLGIRFDERVPFLEDWPMWIMLTERGIRLDFLDKETVCYKVGGISAIGRVMSISFFRSTLKFDLYYRFESAYNQDKESAIDAFTERQALLYHDIARKMKKTPEYRVGRFILAPWRFFKNLFSR